MIHSDTIKLLRECNAGIKMGVSSITEVVDHVKDTDMYKILDKSREEHNKLGSQTRRLLNQYHDAGKDPNPIAKGMSWMKTNIKLTVNDTDATVADLMTDGCNMGVKSLSRYLNQYAAAEEQVKDITKKLIKLEEQLSVDMRSYL
jgi:uncharacterized protein YaaN involved in tellurite resistance